MGRKKSKYIPRRVNPKAYLTAIYGVQRITPQDQLRFLAPLRAAVQKVEKGGQTKDDWLTLFEAVAYVEEFVRIGVAKDDGWVAETRLVLDTVMQRGTACRAQELQQVRQIVLVFAELIAAITLSQLDQAFSALHSAAKNRSYTGVRYLPAGGPSNASSEEVQTQGS